MRKLLLCAAAGAALLTLADSVAAGSDPLFPGALATTFHQKAVSPPQVDRTLKADRADRAPVIQQAAGSQTHSPQQTARQPTLLDGCELAVSPLSESAKIGRPARCIS